MGYSCFHCGRNSVVWDSDYNLDEYYDDDSLDGVVHVLHCVNCGAKIEYRVEEEEYGDYDEED